MDPEFQYNASAFFSAARSVTFYLQKECRDTEGFDEWYEVKQGKMRESALFSAMVIARNYVVKEDHPSITGFSVHITNDADDAEISELSMRANGVGTAEIIKRADDQFDFQKEDIEIISMDILSQHLSSEYQRKPLLQVCEEFLDELDALLSEWEARIS